MLHFRKADPRAQPRRTASRSSEILRSYELFIFFFFPPSPARATLFGIIVRGHNLRPSILRNRETAESFVVIVVVGGVSGWPRL